MSGFIRNTNYWKEKKNNQRRDFFCRTTTISLYALTIEEHIQRNSITTGSIRIFSLRMKAHTIFRAIILTAAVYKYILIHLPTFAGIYKYCMCKSYYDGSFWLQYVYDSKIVFTKFKSVRNF